ncbi:hypothetical protein ANCCEY_12859 [Ancylostoma ceylanicum]|uniref:Dynactin subunit 6 n=1 Tax=Ancylostoma ceylanicum TaxID=53326 RepID=A0A0D6LA54_9BILA|nr:hypothetical protein ANCCEY_12859 [Ancylostoma ceylanicum]
MCEHSQLTRNIAFCKRVTQFMTLEDGDKVMEIGNQNIIEVGAVIHAPTIGNNNVLHVQCEVSPNSCVSNGCSIGVRCKLFAKETLPERTVIYGKFNERRVANDNPPMYCNKRFKQ